MDKFTDIMNTAAKKFGEIVEGSIARLTKKLDKKLTPNKEGAAAQTTANPPTPPPAKTNTPAPVAPTPAPTANTQSVSQPTQAPTTPGA